MIDDMVNASFKCLRAIRDAERQEAFPDTGLKRLEEAQAYLNILKDCSPSMYNILHEEYGRVLTIYKDKIIPLKVL